MIGTRPLLHNKTQDKQALKFKDQSHKRDLNDHPWGRIVFIIENDGHYCNQEKSLNDPPTRGNKGCSASKTNSAPAAKLKNVKMEDDPPLAIVMKELNELKLQISKNKSSYFRNKNSQQCKRTNNRTCDHADFMSFININQYHTGQGESSLRSRPTRVSKDGEIVHEYFDGFFNHVMKDCQHAPLKYSWSITIGIKILLNAASITAAHIRVNAAQLC
ncbi:hypothetical protein Tco_1235871 [Tanacetum coccineum]